MNTRNLISSIMFTAFIVFTSSMALGEVEIKAESVEGNRLFDMGSTAYKQGNIHETARLWELAIEHFNHDLGVNHIRTVRAIHALATTYQNLGQYEKALPFNEQATRRGRAILGESHRETLRFSHSLANTYYYLSQYDKALQLNETILNARHIQFGEEDVDTLNSMNNLALTYREIGEYEKALELHQKTFDVRHKKFGDNNRDTLRSMNNVAVLYRDLGQYEEALAWTQKTWEGRRTRFGENDRETLRSMNNLAAIYTNLNQHSKALELNIRTLHLVRTNFGDESDEALHAMGNLAITYSDLGQYNKALELEERTVQIRRTKFGDKNPDTLRSLNNLAVAYIDVGQSDNALFIIKEIFSATEEIRKLPNLNQEQRQSIFASYSSDYQYYARLYSESKPNKLEEAFSIGDLSKARTLAENIKEKSISYSANPMDAKHLLHDDEVFISYMIDSKERAQAFVLDVTGNIQWMDLGKIHNYAKTIATYRQLTSKLGGDDKERGELSSYWYKKLIYPIIPLIRNAKHWIISPDKDLALLPFDTFVKDHNISLVQSFAVYALLKQREAQYAKLSRNKELLLMGNPFYGEGWMPERGIPSQFHSPAAEYHAMRQKRWFNLRASGYEIDIISKMFADSADRYEGLDASESQLLQLNAKGKLKDYRYLLFSAHGYLAQNPSLSALVLSQKNNPEGIDGYVTASEWSGYDLNSDLIVLSACDTGVGKAQAGESVMGLPYALFVAGNTNTLLTLWPVNDEATAEFMYRFFSKLKDGISQHEALHQTKQEFMSLTRYKHPYFWAGFVLYGV